jgi:hypothetical protein
MTPTTASILGRCDQREYDLQHQEDEVTNTTKTVLWVPVNEYPWSMDDLTHKKLTCKNHPTAYYLTKHVWQRSLHVIHGPIEHPHKECECPFDDLVVVINNENKED